VVRAVAVTGIPRDIIVVDNGSTDRTAERARRWREVIAEPQRGRTLALPVFASLPGMRYRRFSTGTAAIVLNLCIVWSIQL
jgi:glycosyltransferase involved in cell wall biosynthesis